MSNSKSEDTVYVCPIKDCDRFVVGEEGVLWTCADHGENMILQKYKAEPPQDTSLDDIRKCFRDTYMETDGDTELFDTEETIKAISAWHKAEVAKLFEQIRSEVIKDDKDIDFPENAGNHWTYPKIRNRLRAEQLEALTRLEDNVINGGSL